MSLGHLLSSWLAGEVSGRTSEMGARGGGGR